ncbi:MAG: TolC family protein [Burkholderiales bacterium]|nr:TolC family protein [Burkholderiales bacterium]
MPHPLPHPPWTHRLPAGSLVLWLACLLAPAPAAAQTMAQALEQAWARHPRALAATALQDEADARSEAARRLTPGPASLSLGGTSDRFHSNQGQREWEAELAIPLWLPGQKAVQAAEAAGAQADIATQQAVARLQLAGALRTAWWTLAAARQAAALAARRVESSQALLADVQRRHRAGELARIDANLAHGELLTAQSALADAEALVRQAERDYQALTGHQPPQQLEGEQVSDRLTPPPDHPWLDAARASVERARLRLQGTSISRRAPPELALRMLRDRSAAGQPYSHTVGIKLTLPLSSAPQVRQAEAAALAALAQAEAEQEQAQRRLALATDKARSDLDTAAQQLARARERLALDTDTLHLAEKSFALGETGLATLLRARAAALEAEALVGQQQIALAAARSRWNQTLGELP